jgi:transcriptional regulator GlxA family with amidase domain
MVALLIEVVRLDTNVVIRPKRGGLSQRQLKLACEYIEQHVSTRIALRDLAALTGLSLSHFSHAFKRSTGMPPHRWQLQARIRRAQELLVATAQPLSEVATQTGFADQAHFTRVFRRVAGMTPRVWRSQHP